MAKGKKKFVIRTTSFVRGERLSSQRLDELREQAKQNTIHLRPNNYRELEEAINTRTHETMRLFIEAGEEILIVEEKERIVSEDDHLKWDAIDK